MKQKIKFIILILFVFLSYSIKICSFAPGDLDPTFGTGGIVTTNFSGVSELETLIQLSNVNSKVLAIGAGPSQSLLSEYNFNGSLNSSFGDGGKVATTVADGITVIAGAMQSTGKILSMGPDFTANTLIIRYNPNGSIDTSFGTNGIIAVPIATYQHTLAIIVQQDNKILLAGQISPGGGFFVARLNSDGTTDTTFGAGTGVVTYLTNAEARAIALQSDGKIIASGPDNTSTGLFVARLNTDGTLDPSFNAGGPTPGINIISIGGVSDFGNSIAIQGNGKIVVAGETDAAIDAFPFVLRLNADGTLDNSFATAGILIITQFNGGPLDGIFNSVGLQNDGKIIAAGQATLDNFATENFLIGRVNTNGTLDNTYGTGGLVITDLGGFMYITITSVVVNQSNNLATVGGFAGSPVTFTLARYLPTSQLPPPPPSTLSFSVDQAGSLFVPAPGLLADQSPGSLVILLTPPSHGIISISADGSFVYVPNADFSGTDSFTYTISTNGVISSVVNTVLITIPPDPTLATSGIGAELVHAIRQKYGTRT